MISSYHSDRKSWILKGLSLFVIFTFLLTQSDVQLAFAYGVVPNVSLPAPDLAKDDKIHYAQDFSGLDKKTQTNQDPLQKTVDPNAPLQATNLTPTSATTIPKPFDVLNPLTDSTNKTSDTSKTSDKPDADNNMMVAYTDGTYFKYNNTNKNITEICDLVSGHFEIRKFQYTGTASVTIVTSTCVSKTTANGTAVTVDTKPLAQYETFTLTADGQLDKQIESGLWNWEVTGTTSSKIPTFLVTVSGGVTLTTFYDRDDPAFYIKRVYQNLATAGLGRLVGYEKVMTDGSSQQSNINLEIKYDDTKTPPIMTVIDHSSAATSGTSIPYWEYALGANNTRGALLAVGEMESTGTSPKVLVRMALTTATSTDVPPVTTNTFTITDPQDAKQLVVFERTDGGAFGRILEYQTDTVWLKYVYEAPSTENPSGSVTVLNYIANTFVKMAFVAPSQDNSGILDLPISNIQSAGTLTATAPRTQTTLLTFKENVWTLVDPTDNNIFDVYSSFPSNIWGDLIRSRGPPYDTATPAEYYVDYSFVYDPSTHRVYSYDLTHLRYALYDCSAGCSDTQPPLLIGQGTFQVTTGTPPQVIESSRQPSGPFVDIPALSISSQNITDVSTQYDAVSQLAQHSAVAAAVNLLQGGSPYFAPGSVTLISHDDSSVVLRYSGNEYTFSYANGAARLESVDLAGSGGTFQYTYVDEGGIPTAYAQNSASKQYSKYQLMSGSYLLVAQGTYTETHDADNKITGTVRTPDLTYDTATLKASIFYPDFQYAAGVTALAFNAAHDLVCFR